MNTVTIYSLDVCPNCELIKEKMIEMGISYVNKDMSESDSIAELAINGVYTMNAPVIEIDNNGVKRYFYDKMLMEKSDNDKTILTDELYSALWDMCCS